MSILFFLVAGMCLGYLLRSKSAVLAVAEKGMIWSVYLLVFFLGISVGVNQAVVRALGSLGLQALVLSLGGIVGSALLSWVVSRTFFESPRHEK
ncbi:MAG: LysO family transporter [candidate division NC10 bacterium]|nr:LysO family transporter [candidate division NC10 bacterium]